MLIHVGKIQPDVSVFPSKTESEMREFHVIMNLAYV